MIGYNGCISQKKRGRSVKIRNLPYPFLRGQPLKLVQKPVAFAIMDSFEITIPGEYQTPSGGSLQPAIRHSGMHQPLPRGVW